MPNNSQFFLNLLDQGLDYHKNQTRISLSPFKYFGLYILDILFHFKGEKVSDNAHFLSRCSLKAQHYPGIPRPREREIIKILLKDSGSIVCKD